MYVRGINFSFVFTIFLFYFRTVPTERYFFFHVITFNQKCSIFLKISLKYDWVQATREVECKTKYNPLNMLFNICYVQIHVQCNIFCKLFDYYHIKQVLCISSNMSLLTMYKFDIIRLLHGRVLDYTK